MHTASDWIVIDPEQKKVQCLLCPHVCRIPPDGRGICRVRHNQGGKLEVSNYGLITAATLDPLEKKPLKRFMKGKKVFSLGTVGCNLTCSFCQNWSIAHGDLAQGEYLTPEDVLARAQDLVEDGNIGIAYTYSEPLMWYEFVLDTASLVKESGSGLKNVLVTNGYLNPRPLKRLLPYIDAVNLDIKANTEGFYQDICGGRLAPVLTSARLFAEYCHLEITTLLVTGLNDDPEEVERLASWVAGIDRKIPLHLTRYFPAFRLKLPPTPLQRLEKAKTAAEKHLDYVFLGNV